MSSPIDQNRPTPATPIKITDEYQWLAKNIAIYTHQHIPAHLEDHDGQIDYQDLANEVIQFLRRTAPAFEGYDKNVFLKCLATELNNRVVDLPFPHNRISAPIFKRLVIELRDKLLPRDDKFQRRRIQSGFSNTSTINSLAIGIRQGVGDNGHIAAGVFRSGDTGTALSQYTAFHYQWLRVNHPSIKAGITSSIGAFSLFPDDNLENRYVIGIAPSLSLFLGSEQRLGYGFRLREAAEWLPSMPVGIHLTTDLHAPLTVGASVEKNFIRTRAYSGAAIQTLFVTQDVQDPKSRGIVTERIHWFMGIESPLVDAKLSLDFFHNETVGKLQLSKDVPFAGGLTTFALVSQAPLNGEWNAESRSTFLMVSYAQRHPRTEIRASVGIDLESENEPTYSETNPAAGSFDAEKVSSSNATSAVGSKASCDLSNYYKSGSSATSCTISNINNGKAIPCTIDGKAKNVQCSVTTNKSFDLTYKVHMGYNTSGKLVADSVTEQHFIAKDPVLNSLTQNTTRVAFVQSLRALSKDQQLSGLQQLPKILYRTYNSIGLATILGNDTVNLIDSEELYQSIRKYLLDPKSVDPTTVCRGIAKFVAGVAGDLGFESHVVGLRTNTSNHAITLVREPGKDYLVINYGDEVGNTRHTDMVGALLQFAKNNGYPPQLKFRIYDKNGQYERSLITNEGRLVMENTTSPDQAQDFLEFR